MKTAPARRSWVLVGATATGKSAVAHRLALETGCAVASADSMMVYRGMDIGTAKPTASERSEVRYIGLDYADPDRPFSVGEYRERLLAEWVAEPCPILAGGTGLYVAALLRGLDGAEPVPEPVRRAVRDLEKEQGLDGLRARLERVSPGALGALSDPRNPRRVARALEKALTGGPDAGSWRGAADQPVIVGLRRQADDLERRIRRRIEWMYGHGLPEEAAELRHRWPAWSETARHAIGYAEALAALDGALTTDDAMERTAVRTRQYAKRQMTWFRRQANVDWIDVPADEDDARTAERVRAAWEKHGPATLQD